MVNTQNRFLIMTLFIALLISGCSSTPHEVPEVPRYSQWQDSAPGGPIDFASVPEPVPKAEPLSKYGNPESYIVRGKRYRRKNNIKGFRQRGIASWYGVKFHGHRTSSGETFDMYKVTAAHTTLPLPTYARVTNLDNGRSIIVRINDRGPFHDNRIIDLSYVAAGKLGILQKGTGRVELVVIDPDQSQPTAQPQVIATVQKPLRHYVQLGAFSERDNAVKLEQRLPSAIVAKLRISPANTDNGTIYRVQVGPFSSEVEARQMSERLATYGVSDAVVIGEQI